MRLLNFALATITVLLLASGAMADPFSFVSTDTPLPIPPSGSAGTTISTLVVAGPAGTITDLNVTVSINHTFDGDLDLILSHVDTGTSVLLFDQRGGSGNDIFATFDDAAALPISLGSPPFSGTFRPEAPLSALNGESLLGSWRLTVVDNLFGDVGTLNRWSIQGTFTPIPEPSGLALLGTAAAFLAWRRRRRNRA
jgi:subtilisin-like proprotein convertase family protein